VGNHSLGCGGGGVGNRYRTTTRPTAPPTIWAPMKTGAEAGAIPANVSENIRPIVTAGLANEVELVNQYAAPI
jgi:hypothetical protein